MHISAILYLNCGIGRLKGIGNFASLKHFYHETFD
jgi:hypothetical protein